MEKKPLYALIEPGELYELLENQEKGLVLIDARSGPEVAREYDAFHIGGALRIDLEEDLSNIREDPGDGGRHPLPEPAAFSLLLGKLGIDPETHVVVYDDKSGASAAARFWWMLRAAGHKKVQVLNGGLDAAIQAGIPASIKPVDHGLRPPYPFTDWMLPLANMDEVERAAKDKNHVVIDVREAERYRGETEPYDLVAGHIPGAVNIPYSLNLDENGFFHSPEKLREIYGKPLEGRRADQVIVHCGSGVTACHSILAMEIAGLEIPKLFVGSFSEWSRNDKPIKP